MVAGAFGSCNLFTICANLFDDPFLSKVIIRLSMLYRICLKPPLPSSLEI